MAMAMAMRRHPSSDSGVENLSQRKRCLIGWIASGAKYARASAPKLSRR